MSDSGVSRERWQAARGPGFAAGDAHAPVDPEAVLDDTTVVIPTNRPDNHTLESLPEFLAADAVIADQDGLNVARNRGIEDADGDWIVLIDDDTTFPTALTATLIDAMHPMHLVGLEDAWPMRWVLGRYMLFHRSLWEQVGGFDESRHHGGDTDFAIRCESAGARVCRLPRRIVPHHDASGTFDAATHREWLWYLLTRHPQRIAVPAVKLVGRKLGLLGRRRADYPADWASEAFVPPDASGGLGESDEAASDPPNRGDAGP
jgi:hypothetical protein